MSSRALATTAASSLLLSAHGKFVTKKQSIDKHVVLFNVISDNKGRSLLTICASLVTFFILRRAGGRYVIVLSVIL